MGPWKWYDVRAMRKKSGEDVMKKAKVLVSCVAVALAATAAPVKVIFDTDMITDFDDVGAGSPAFTYFISMSAAWAMSGQRSRRGFSAMSVPEKNSSKAFFFLICA